MKVKAGTTFSFDRRFKSLTLKGSHKKQYAKNAYKVTISQKVAPIVLKIALPLLILTGVWIACEQANVSKTETVYSTSELTEPFERDTVARELSAVERDGRYQSADIPKAPTVQELIAKYFPENAKLALAIAECESHFNPLAYNGKGLDESYGVFQINIKGKLAKNRPTAEELKDAETNIKFARKLYEQAGNTFSRDWVICHKLNKGVK